MTVILNIIAPVFGLIAVGYLVARFKLLSSAAAQGISEFAFTLGIPALLCRTIATAHFEHVAPAAIWISFFGAAAIVWLVATVWTPLVLARPAADAPSISMSSIYGNTVMLGLPLCIASYGPEATPIVALVVSIHAPLLLTAAALHSAAVGDTPAAPREIVNSLWQDFARNPIILGIVAGALWRVTGLELPTAIDRFLELLAAAGVPAGLTALGLTLVSFQIKGQVPTLATVLVLKLVAMPIVAWVIAAKFFALPELTVGVITILAAMPAGANAYLFAVHEKRALNSASGAVALGTILTAATATVVISLIGR